MNHHTTFDLPLCLIIDEDILGRIDEILLPYMPQIKDSKALIITEAFLQNMYAEPLSKLQEDFGNAQIMNVENADYDTAVSIAKKICIENIKVVFGFGGGKVLDVAKYAAFVSKTDYICLPSNLSNDSLSSPFAVLNTEGSARKTLPCAIPAAIIVDTSVIKKAPDSQIIGGIGDTISKYTAVYDYILDNKHNNSHADDFACSIAGMCYDSVAHCDEKSIHSNAFIKILSRALVMGGLAMEIAGSSRPCSGSEHLFCHALEEYYPEIKISHGYAVALGSIAAANFQGRDDRKIIEVCKTFGLDLNPESYGIDRDLFSEIWNRASSTRPDRYTILNVANPDRQWLDKIYERMQQ